MNSAGTIAPRERLSESQREALIKLLADDDQAIYQTIRDKIRSYGPQATEWLRPHTLSRDPVLRRRALEIVRPFHRRGVGKPIFGLCPPHEGAFGRE